MLPLTLKHSLLAMVEAACLVPLDGADRVDPCRDRGTISHDDVNLEAVVSGPVATHDRGAHLKALRHKAAERFTNHRLDCAPAPRRPRCSNAVEYEVPSPTFHLVKVRSTADGEEREAGETPPGLRRITPTPIRAETPSSTASFASKAKQVRWQRPVLRMLWVPTSAFA